MRRAFFGLIIISCCLVSVTWCASSRAVREEPLLDEQQASRAREAEPRPDGHGQAREAEPRLDEPGRAREVDPRLDGDASVIPYPTPVALHTPLHTVMDDGHVSAHSSMDDLDDLLKMTSSWDEAMTSRWTNEREGGALVQRLREQLGQARVTHMHARSVINELQERQEAQDADLEMLKNELTRLRAEQRAQHDQLSSLGATTSNAAWALADMKQGQAQASADFSAFKLVQAHSTDDLSALKQAQAQFSADLASMKQVQTQASADLGALKLVEARTAVDFGALKLIQAQASEEVSAMKQSQAQTAGDLRAVKEGQEQALEAIRELREAQEAMSEEAGAARQVTAGLADAVSLLESRQGALGTRQGAFGSELGAMGSELGGLGSKLGAMRQVQDQHNDTLLVMEEVMMSNAIELQTLHHQAATARQDLAQVRAQLAEDRLRLKTLHTQLHPPSRHQRTKDPPSRDLLPAREPFSKSKETSLSRDSPAERGVTKDWRSSNSNEWLKAEQRRPTNMAAVEGRGVLLDRSRPFNTSDKLEASWQEFKAGIEGRLDVLGGEVRALREWVEGRGESQAEFNAHLEGRGVKGDELLTLGQGGVSGTNGTLDSQAAQAGKATSGSLDKVSTSRERRLAPDADPNALDRTTEGTDSNILATLQRANEQVLVVLHEHEAQSGGILRDLEGRVEALGARVWRGEEQGRRLEEQGWSLEEQGRRLEQLLLNASLQQSKQANFDLHGLASLVEVKQKLMSHEVKFVQQALVNGRFDATLAAHDAEMSKQKAVTPSFSEQLTSLKRLQTEVAAVQRQQLNFIRALPSDCSDVSSSPFTPLRSSSQPGGGEGAVYLIRPNGSNYSLRVYCATPSGGVGFSRLHPQHGGSEGAAKDQAEGEDSPPEEEGEAEKGAEEEEESEGWIVIQRRLDGSEDFNRTWEEYKEGFGVPEGEHWLGNEHIHRLTARGVTPSRAGLGAGIGHGGWRLRVELWDAAGRYWVASYSSFSVQSEREMYRVELGAYSGNASDALRYSDEMFFSALDRDHDVSTTHCAQFYAAGWWYKHCHHANLNGRRPAGVVWFHAPRDEWLELRRTTMMISWAADYAGAGGGGERGRRVNE